MSTKHDLAIKLQMLTSLCSQAANIEVNTKGGKFITSRAYRVKRLMKQALALAKEVDTQLTININNEDNFRTRAVKKGTTLGPR